MAVGSGVRSDVEAVNSVVTKQCLEELLEYFHSCSYRARTLDRRSEIIHKQCICLIARDYKIEVWCTLQGKIEVVDNKDGALCGHYPSELVVIEGHANSDDDAVVNSTSVLKELFTRARFARCRSRFVMPVLLYRNKNICRSATLATMVELYGRSGIDWFTTGGEGIADGRQRPVEVPTASEGASGENRTTPATDEEWGELVTRIRKQDVQLLKTLSVKLICDLMVEKRKTKYGLQVSSSEKVDKWGRYVDFNIASIPYPGCEFFRHYKVSGCVASRMQYDWNQPEVDTELHIPPAVEELIPVSFLQYKGWNLAEVTQNYLRLLVGYLKYGEGGILIHCISGWDRTPLFISLLRLSLWADGEAHSSLCASEMLYLTLAYDWLIYGHQLKDRHGKGEDIMFFCFDFLKYIASDEFSINHVKRPSPMGESATYSCSQYRLDGVQEFGESWSFVGVSGSEKGGRSPCLSRQTLPAAFNEDGLTTSALYDRQSDLVHLSGQHSGLAATHNILLDSLKPSESIHSRPLSFRQQKLTEVRELFLSAFENSLPPAVQTTGGLFGGLLSKLWTH